MTETREPRGESRFRRWLIDRLKETSFAVYKGELVVDVARRLGVSVDVLKMAQAEKTTELQQMGRTPTNLGGRGHERGYALMLRCPPEARKEIHELARRMGARSSELIRGVTQTLLSGPDNPQWLGRHWIWHGKHILLRPVEGKGWPWFVDVYISRGAAAALQRRAERLGTNKTALIRSATVDFLEGRMTGIQLLPTAEMWNDPNRYWTGELKREGRYVGHPGIV